MVIKGNTLYINTSDRTNTNIIKDKANNYNINGRIEKYFVIESSFYIIVQQTHLVVVAGGDGLEPPCIATPAAVKRRFSLEENYMYTYYVLIEDL